MLLNHEEHCSSFKNILRLGRVEDLKVRLSYFIVKKKN